MQRVRLFVLCTFCVILTTVACKKTGDAPSDTAPTTEDADLAAQADSSTDTVRGNPRVPYQWSKETFGGFHLGMQSTAVEARLAAPKKKEAPEVVPATGDIVARWTYPNEGIWFEMRFESEDPTSQAVVGKMGVHAPSTYRTSLGVGIGSSYEQALNAYQNVHDPDQEDDMESDDRQTIIIGSVYGGLIIRFHDGVVEEMLLGAAAE